MKWMEFLKTSLTSLRIKFGKGRLAAAINQEESRRKREAQ
jgi:hypothetical protein